MGEPVLKLGAGPVRGLHRKQARVSGKDYERVLQAPMGPMPKVAPVMLFPALVEGFVFQYLLGRFDQPVATPTFHKRLWEAACDPAPLVALAAPRGHAKSTALTHSYNLCSSLFRNQEFTVIVSNTWSQAVEFLRDIKSELQENEGIQRDFQIWKFIKDSEDDLIVQIRDGHKFRMMARGSEQKVRGLKWGHRRPGMYILDDIEDDEQVESKERREKLSNWVLKALIPAGSDKCLVRMVGTVMHFDSFLENALKSGSWLSRRFKAHRDYDDFSELLWPEKFTEQRLRSIRQIYIDQGNPDGYAQEYLNYPVSEQDAYFYRQDLLPIPSDLLRDIRQGLVPLRKYAGWDFAVSKADRADYTVCTVIGVDSNGNKYVLDVRRGRWDAKEIIDEVFRVERDHKPEFHAVEKGIIERAIGPFLNAESARRQIYPNLYEINSSKDKRVRGRSWQGATRAHHVYYDKSLSEYPTVENEMTRFPKGEHDDCVDSQTILGLLLEQVFEAPTASEAAAEDEAEHMAFVRRTMGESFGGRSRVTGY